MALSIIYTLSTQFPNLHKTSPYELTCTIKFWRDMDGGTTCGKGGPKFAVTDGPGGPFLRGDQKFRDRSSQWSNLP